MIALLGTDAPPLWGPQARRLTTTDPRIVNKFNDIRINHMQLLQLQDELTKIEASINPVGMTTQNMEIFEEQDALRIQGIVLADKKCRKLQTGNVAWSPAIQISINRIRYIRACKCNLDITQKHKVHRRTLCKLFKKSNFSEKILNYDEAVVTLQLEYEEYNKLKILAKSNRLTFMEELSVVKAQQDDLDPANMLKQLQLRERQREMARKIKRIKGIQRVGVKAVETPGEEENTWVLQTEKKEIEKGCMDKNKRRFTQANHTPSLLKDQVNILGWTGNNQVSRNILQGSTIGDEVHEDIRDMAPYLATPITILERGLIDNQITVEEFCEGWKKSKEYTSSGSMDIHFGHFKTSARNDVTATMDTAFINICLKTGYSLKRWSNGIDVMIPKKSDSIRVSALRTIVLMEPDFNFTNKIIGRRIMYNAEQAGTVAIEQYGSRKAKSSIIHAMNKQMTHDIVNQSKEDSSLIVLDALSCFDRIAPPMAAISLKRQGAPQVFVDVMFNTLSSMKHKIRTSFGDSELSYQETKNDKFHGILQGNGAGPTIWAMVSTPILDRMRDKGCGIKITNLVDNTSVTIPAFAFVDDTDLVQSIADMEDTKKEAQQSVDLWESGLRATGGALVPDKCSWYSLIHEWTNDKWVLQQDGVDQIHIQTTEGTEQVIQKKNPDAATLALGIMFAPNGNMDAETEYLQTKGSAWAENERSNKMNREEAWYMLTAIVMKTIEYLLLATSLTQQQMETVMKPILGIGLPKSGICRNIARDVVYSTTTYQGIGLRNPFITQGLQKLMMLLNESSEVTNVSNILLKTAIEWTRIESGMGPTFLLKSYPPFRKVIHRGWVATLWEFLDNHNIHLISDKEHIQEFCFEGDCYLMERISQYIKSSNELLQINRCRIFLQIELLSDMVTADGLKFRNDIWEGRKSNMRRSRGKWPNQPCPGNSLWVKWRNVLSKTFGANETGIFEQRKNSIMMSTNWRWYFSPTYTRLYEMEEEVIKVYSITRNARGRTRSQHAQFGQAQDDTTLNLPDDATPVTVYKSSRNWIIDGKSEFRYQVYQETNRTKWIQSIIEVTTGSDTILKNEFLQGRLCIVSDGSYKNNVASGAWILTSVNCMHEHFIEGTARSTGVPVNQDSHRAECIGILGGITRMNYYLDKWDISEGTVTFACDNMSALRYSMDTIRYQCITANHPDFDVLQAI